MHVCIVFAHPSGRSFSRAVLEAFARGLREAGHDWEVADLYAMDFRAELDEAEYLRETSGDPDLPVLCSAGHTAEHLEETGIAEAMRRILLNDRLLGLGVRQADLEILGGMLPGEDSWRERNLRRAYELGRDF